MASLTDLKWRHAGAKLRGCVVPSHLLPSKCSLIRKGFHPRIVFIQLKYSGCEILIQTSLRALCLHQNIKDPSLIPSVFAFMYMYPLHFPIETNYSALRWAPFFFFFWHLRFMARVDFGQRMRFDIQGRHEDESSLPALLLRYWLPNAANRRSSSSASATADWDICSCIVIRFFGSVFLHCVRWKSPNFCASGASRTW